MRSRVITGASSDARMAARLRALRGERGWSLDELARRADVSRATLSRIENAEVSPTAAVLGRLAAAYGLTMSRLMAMVEADFVALMPRERQVTWVDPETGLRRTNVSPPAETLAAELIACTLPAGARIAYPETPRAGLEHHLYLLDGCLQMTIEGERYRLRAGDCLRYQLHGPSLFETPAEQAARYILAIV
jgi:transcriptional regulator with XRE-family HTH domain